MAVAHDASSESHSSGGGGSQNEDSFSWTHTPAGTPKGVLVFVFTIGANADYATGVTYGGQALSAVTGGLAADTAGEPARCKAYFLGTGLPTGAQTVVVSRTNNATVMYAIAVTVTALADTEVYTAGIVLLQEDGQLHEQSPDDGSPGTNSVRYAGLYYGQTAFSTGANSTALQQINITVPSSAAIVWRETTAGQGARPVGGEDGVTVDDRAGVHLAVRELVVTSNIKSVNSVARANIGKINSVTWANVKKVNSVSNT